MLKLHFKDNRQSACWVTEKLYLIGSASDNQLVIDDASIDSLHAKIFAEDEKYVLKDNNSANGCFINVRRNQAKSVHIKAQSVAIFSGCFGDTFVV